MYPNTCLAHGEPLVEQRHELGADVVDQRREVRTFHVPLGLLLLVLPPLPDEVVVLLAGLLRRLVFGHGDPAAPDHAQRLVRPPDQLGQDVGERVAPPVGVVPGEVVAVLLQPLDRDAVEGAAEP